MPLVTGSRLYYQGVYPYHYKSGMYCVNNTSASDYGKCYNTNGSAIFVQADTTTYPKLACETDGTCIRQISTAGVRSYGTVFDYGSKQGILQYFYSRTHTVPYDFIYGNVQYIRFMAIPFPGPTAGLFPSPNYEVSSWPVYDPVINFKVYINPYTIPGNVGVLKWQGSYFTSKLDLIVAEEGNNNIWYGFDVKLTWAYESSPLAIIPLDYDRDYVPYQELRSAFGYAATGVDQPGWNADDMIRVLRELFPNRAWAVFDDRLHMLYLYNLTPDYVPDWLIEKLAPTAMKVLQSPADATVAKTWLDLLNERNAQIPPQAELP